MLLLVNIIDVKTHIVITSIIINDLQGDRETWKLIVFLVTYNSGLGYYYVFLGKHKFLYRK